VPKGRSWEIDGNNFWEINLCKQGNYIQGTARKQSDSGFHSMVDPNSEIYRYLSRAFQPLEPKPCGVLVTAEPHCILQKLTIYVNRQRITFTLDEKGRLASRDFPGYILDQDLSAIGCLIGLQNILAFHRENDNEASRMVIIPRGAFSFEKGPFGHPLTRINVESSSGYFRYDQDKLLGRLVGNLSLESDLFLTLLHAYTSSYLPDPLTGRPGIIESLERLQSPANISIMDISRDSRELLEEIAALSPQRTFYPPHLQAMEKVLWKSYLPMHSQRPEFRLYVELILEEWQKTSIFHQQHELVAPLRTGPGSDLLIARALSRTYIGPVYTHEISVKGDFKYYGRSPIKLNFGPLAFQIVRSSKTGKIRTKKNFFNNLSSWRTVSAVESWRWRDVDRWLGSTKPPSIQNVWPTLYQLCRTSDWPPKLEVVIILGLLVYRGISPNAIGALLTIIKDDIFRSESFAYPLSPHINLNLDNGSVFNRDHLKSLLSQCTIDPQKWRARQVPGLRNAGQTDPNYSDTGYPEELSRQIAVTMAELEGYWPDRVEMSINVLLNSVLNISEEFIRMNIIPILLEWSRNRAFSLHVDALQRSVNTSLQETQPISVQTAPSPVLPYLPSSTYMIPSIEDLLASRQPPPSLSPSIYSEPKVMDLQAKHETHPEKDLQDLVRKVGDLSRSDLEHRYSEDLAASMQALAYRDFPTQSTLPDAKEIRDISLVTRELQSQAFSCFRNALEPRDYGSCLLAVSGVWPAITPMTLLRQLALPNRVHNSSPWMDRLIEYAILLHDTRRAFRMVELSKSTDTIRLLREMSYVRVWDPKHSPDWLLMEIDGNFTIRPEQASLATKMLSPDNQDNAVMQLSMGEGKSSVSRESFDE
jgi:hypothetical protein